MKYEVNYLTQNESPKPHRYRELKQTKLLGMYLIVFFTFILNISFNYFSIALLSHSICIVYNDFGEDWKKYEDKPNPDYANAGGLDKIF